MWAKIMTSDCAVAADTIFGPIGDCAAAAAGRRSTRTGSARAGSARTAAARGRSARAVTGAFASVFETWTLRVN